MTHQPLITYGFIGFSILVGVAGQTALKLGVQSLDAADALIQLPISLLIQAIRSPLVLLGLLLYALGAAAWILVLARVDLSFAYPFLALNFILITFSSRFLLGEYVPVLRWVGVLIICAGILLIAASKPTG